MKAHATLTTTAHGSQNDFVSRLRQFYATQAIADQVGAAHVTVWRWIQSGRLGAVRVGPKGGRLRVPAVELERFIRSQSRWV